MIGAAEDKNLHMATLMRAIILVSLFDETSYPPASWLLK